jgi:hypothetical protein
VGRSLFRSYAEPRHLAFGNTYQKRVYWMSPTETVECDEPLLQCQKHVHADSAVFGVTRQSQPATDEEVAPLQYLAASHPTTPSATRRSRMPLVQDNAAVREIGPETKGSVFGGQYFTLQADEEVAVSLDATVVGRGALIQLDSDLYARGGIYDVLPPPLYDGDSVQFEYVYAPGKVQDNIEIRLRARALSNHTAHLILNETSMTTRKRSSERAGVATTRFRVSREETPRTTRFLGSGVPPQTEDGGLRNHGCLRHNERGEWTASGCPATSILTAPLLEAKVGSRIKLRCEIEATQGSFELQAQFGPAGDPVSRAQSKLGVFDEKHTRRTISLSYKLKEAAENLEARLALVQTDGSAAFVIQRAVLEVSP